MRFPATIHIPISSPREYDALMEALQRSIDDHSEEGLVNANLLQILASRITYNEQNGSVKDLPEAWLEVSGKRLAEGSRDEMNQLFDSERVAHRAPLILRARKPGSAEWAVVRQRQ